MNDLMTRSFLSYVELEKQAQMDLDVEQDLEKGQLSHADEENLSMFFQEIEAVKINMQDITNLLVDLQSLNEETKSTHSAKVLKGLRDRMDSDMVDVLRKAKIVKARLEALDKSNIANRKLSVAFAEGSAIDRTRMSTTNGVRLKLKEIMTAFQDLRAKILSDYKESLGRRYYNETGEVATEEVIERMVSEKGQVEIFKSRMDSDLERHEAVMETKERHEAVIEIQRSLDKLHQVFLDMAVLVDTQGEQIDDIEKNIAIAGSYVSGGTNSLYYAEQMKKKNKSWLLWVCAVALIIFLVCFVGMLSS